ncbi:DUF342 domain-containing protein [Glaciecola sp. 1036]|uniref:DUF342 domain-containing protein n=1 Tax=Alteromonadaceae TaxID=72275 RepID=UPI003D009C95
MKGITFSTINDNKELQATVDPLLCDADLSPTMFIDFIKSSEFSDFKVRALELDDLINAISNAKDEGNLDTIKGVIGEFNTTPYTITVAEDKMSAKLALTKPQSGNLPSVDKLVDAFHNQGVKRGISKKSILQLLNKVAEDKPGVEHAANVAMGLPPRHGKNSRLFPLVPNAIDRVLQPQFKQGDKVDMRNLGEIICVQAGQPIAKRLPPSKGRNGFNIHGDIVKPDEGKWIDIKLGPNTQLDEQNENLIIAAVSGQPKFIDEQMSIDDTFVTKGVNVKTGNINFDGAVIVNGDVTEQMQIISKGDITINGFVESALIRAGGDIIITQGATGKMDITDCQIYANGSVFIQHGQGLDIIAGKDINVGRQLAYSRVKCQGKITVGNPDHPNGSLFASKINAYSTIRAGIVGAVSGSALEIDFSEGFNRLHDRLESVHELHTELRKTNADHVIHASAIRPKVIPVKLWDRMKLLEDALEKEKELLEWLDKMETELREKLAQYETDARVLAFQELYPGVFVKLNKKNWKAEKEYLKSRIFLKNGKWEYEPII